MRRKDPKHSNRRYFRSQDRVFAQNGQWFFASREGELGPFATRESAIKESARYGQERRELDRFQKARELQLLRESPPSLSIVPKDEEVLPGLEELRLENRG